MLPEQGDLNKICRPPHGGRFHQEPPEYTSPSEPQYLPHHGLDKSIQTIQILSI